MTIGPEPIRQIEWRSLRRGNVLHPAFEERPGVVRPWAGLRVELRRARAQVREVEALDGVVVERDVRRLGVVARRDREAVVVARDGDAAGRALEHGLVRAAVRAGAPGGLVAGREA